MRQMVKTIHSKYTESSFDRYNINCNNNNTNNNWKSNTNNYGLAVNIGGGNTV